MKARHITGITGGALLAVAALIAPSVPITRNGSTVSLNQADGICRSGLGEFARFMSPQAQYDCSMVGHLMAVDHLLLIGGQVLVGLCLWRGVVSTRKAVPMQVPVAYGPWAQPGGYGIPPQSAQPGGYGISPQAGQSGQPGDYGISPR